MGLLRMGLTEVLRKCFLLFKRKADHTAVLYLSLNYLIYGHLEISEKVFSGVPFKKFELSNPPTYNYAKTNSAAYISFVCFENFKIGLWWNHI